MSTSSYQNIPPQMRERKAWLTWRQQSRPGSAKLTKVPYIAGTNINASSTNADTWRPYVVAEAAMKTGRYDGIGFALDGSELVALDLDDVHDLETGRITPWAAAVVRKVSSYTEVSPSGRGLRIIIHGQLPPGSKHKVEFSDGSKLEAWDSGRYITMTGNLVSEWPELNAIRDYDFANF